MEKYNIKDGGIIVKDDSLLIETENSYNIPYKKIVDIEYIKPKIYKKGSLEIEIKDEAIFVIVINIFQKKDYDTIYEDLSKKIEEYKEKEKDSKIKMVDLEEDTVIEDIIDEIIENEEEIEETIDIKNVFTIILMGIVFALILLLIIRLVYIFG